MIRDARDVLDLLLGPGAAAERDAAAAPCRSSRALRRLLEAIERGHGSLAELTSDPAASARCSRTSPSSSCAGWSGGSSAAATSARSRLRERADRVCAIPRRRDDRRARSRPLLARACAVDASRRLP